MQLKSVLRCEIPIINNNFKNVIPGKLLLNKSNKRFHDMSLLENTNLGVGTSHQPTDDCFPTTARPIVIYSLNHVTRIHGFLQQFFSMNCKRGRLITDRK